MRVLAYNILDGGGDRTGLLLEVIRRETPDLIALAECRGFEADGRARLRRFERELGMTGVLTEAPSGNHVALLHRPGTEVFGVSSRSASMLNGCARIVVRTAELGPVAVVAAHLHPFSATFRTAEMEIVAARAGAAGEAIVLGDMNSLAPSDAEVDLTGLPRSLAERMRGPTGAVDTRAVALLLARGYRDLGAVAAMPTYPTAIGDEGGGGCRLRLDHVLVTPAVAARCAGFAVPAREPAPRASDHLPVVADFDLSLAGTDP